MNATAMVGRLEETSPKTKVRVVGGLLLITILAGGFAQGFIGAIR
jgi:hypothetical protein